MNLNLRDVYVDLSSGRAKERKEGLKSLQAVLGSPPCLASLDHKTISHAQDKDVRGDTWPGLLRALCRSIDQELGNTGGRKTGPDAAWARVLKEFFDTAESGRRGSRLLLLRSARELMRTCCAYLAHQDWGIGDPVSTANMNTQPVRDIMHTLRNAVQVEEYAEQCPLECMEDMVSVTLNQLHAARNLSDSNATQLLTLLSCLLRALPIDCFEEVSVTECDSCHGWGLLPGRCTLRLHLVTTLTELLKRCRDNVLRTKTTVLACTNSFLATAAADLTPFLPEMSKYVLKSVCREAWYKSEATVDAVVVFGEILLRSGATDGRAGPTMLKQWQQVTFGELFKAASETWWFVRSAPWCLSHRAREAARFAAALADAVAVEEQRCTDDAPDEDVPVSTQGPRAANGVSGVRRTFLEGWLRNPRVWGPVLVEWLGMVRSGDARAGLDAAHVCLVVARANGASALDGEDAFWRMKCLADCVLSLTGGPHEATSTLADGSPAHQAVREATEVAQVSLHRLPGGRPVAAAVHGECLRTIATAGVVLGEDGRAAIVSALQARIKDNVTLPEPLGDGAVSFAVNRSRACLADGGAGSLPGTLALMIAAGNVLGSSGDGEELRMQALKWLVRNAAKTLPGNFSALFADALSALMGSADVRCSHGGSGGDLACAIATQALEPQEDPRSQLAGIHSAGWFARHWASEAHGAERPVSDSPGGVLHRVNVGKIADDLAGPGSVWFAIGVVEQGEWHDGGPSTPALLAMAAAMVDHVTCCHNARQYADVKLMPMVGRMLSELRQKERRGQLIGGVITCGAEMLSALARLAEAVQRAAEALGADVGGAAGSAGILQQFSKSFAADIVDATTPMLDRIKAHISTTVHSAARAANGSSGGFDLMDDGFGSPVRLLAERQPGGSSGATGTTAADVQAAAQNADAALLSPVEQALSTDARLSENCLRETVAALSAACACAVAAGHVEGGVGLSALTQAAERLDADHAGLPPCVGDVLQRAVAALASRLVSLPESGAAQAAGVAGTRTALQATLAVLESKPRIAPPSRCERAIVPCSELLRSAGLEDWASSSGSAPTAEDKQTFESVLDALDDVIDSADAALRQTGTSKLARPRAREALAGLHAAAAVLCKDRFAKRCGGALIELCSDGSFTVRVAAARGLARVTALFNDPRRVLNALCMEFRHVPVLDGDGQSSDISLKDGKITMAIADAGRAAQRAKAPLSPPRTQTELLSLAGVAQGGGASGVLIETAAATLLMMHALTVPTDTAFAHDLLTATARKVGYSSAVEHLQFLMPLLVETWVQHDLGFEQLLDARTVIWGCPAALPELESDPVVLCASTHFAASLLERGDAAAVDHLAECVGRSALDFLRERAWGGVSPLAAAQARYWIAKAAGDAARVKHLASGLRELTGADLDRCCNECTLDTVACALALSRGGSGQDAQAAYPFVSSKVVEKALHEQMGRSIGASAPPFDGGARPKGALRRFVFGPSQSLRLLSLVQRQVVLARGASHAGQAVQAVQSMIVAGGTCWSSPLAFIAVVNFLLGRVAAGLGVEESLAVLLTVVQSFFEAPCGDADQRRGVIASILPRAARVLFRQPLRAPQSAGAPMVGVFVGAEILRTLARAEPSLLRTCAPFPPAVHLLAKDVQEARQTALEEAPLSLLELLTVVTEQAGDVDGDARDQLIREVEAALGGLSEDEGHESELARAVWRFVRAAADVGDSKLQAIAARALARLGPLPPGTLTTPFHGSDLERLCWGSGLAPTESGLRRPLPLSDRWWPLALEHLLASATDGDNVTLAAAARDSLLALLTCAPDATERALPFLKDGGAHLADMRADLAALFARRPVAFDSEDPPLRSRPADDELAKLARKDLWDLSPEDSYEDWAQRVAAALLQASKVVCDDTGVAGAMVALSRTAAVHARLAEVMLFAGMITISRFDGERRVCSAITPHAARVLKASLERPAGHPGHKPGSRAAWAIISTLGLLRLCRQENLQAPNVVAAGLSCGRWCHAHLSREQHDSDGSDSDDVQLVSSASRKRRAQPQQRQAVKAKKQRTPAASSAAKSAAAAGRANGAPSAAAADPLSRVDATEPVLWRKVYWLDIDYQDAARAALHTCGAPFTAWLYWEQSVEEDPGRREAVERELIQAAMMTGDQDLWQNPFPTVRLSDTDARNLERLARELNWPLHLSHLEGYEPAQKDPSIRAQDLLKMGCPEAARSMLRHADDSRSAAAREVEHEAAWRMMFWEECDAPDVSSLSDALCRGDPVDARATETAGSGFHESFAAALAAVRTCGPPRKIRGLDGCVEEARRIVDAARAATCRLVGASTEEISRGTNDSIVRLVALDLVPGRLSPDRSDVDTTLAATLTPGRAFAGRFELLEPLFAAQSAVLRATGAWAALPSVLERLADAAIAEPCGVAVSHAASCLRGFEKMLGARSATVRDAAKHLREPWAMWRMLGPRMQWGLGRQWEAATQGLSMLQGWQVSEEDGEAAINYVRISCTAAQWAAETHSVSSQAIRDVLESARDLANDFDLDSPVAAAVACDANFKLASYLDRLRGELEDQMRGEEWREHGKALEKKGVEVAAMQQRLDARAARGEVRWDNGQMVDRESKYMRHYMAKMQAVINADMQERRRVEQRAKKFTEHAMQAYSDALFAGSAHDLAGAFGWCRLWLSHPQSAEVNRLARDACSHTPTHKLVPLAYQVASRISNVDNDNFPGFQDAISHMMRGMLLDHPHHVAYHLLSLANGLRDHGGREGSPSGTQLVGGMQRVVDESKVAGAKRILAAYCNPAQVSPDAERRAKTAYLQEVLGQTKRLVDAYIRLAAADPEKTSVVPSAICRDVRDLDKVPVVSMNLPLDPLCRYLRADGPSGAPSEAVTFERFESKVSLVGGINKPKLIAVRGSDGRLHKELIKSGNDDLRQDAVMTQIFRLVTELLAQDKHSASTGLRMQTYKVVPFTPHAGLVEWINQSTPLSEWLLGPDRRHGAHLRYKKPGQWSFGQCLKVMQDALGNPDTQLASFARCCRNFPPVLRYYFLETFRGPTEWFTRRQAFVRSVAVASMVGHVVGLGDRHSANILLLDNSAEVVHIDLGIAFEQGKFLNTPEQVPFRLTRDIVDGMGVQGVEGSMRRSSEKVMSVLRASRSLLSTILDVFLHDPLYNWTLTPVDVARRQHDEGSDDEAEEARWASREVGGGAFAGAEGNKSGGSADAARAVLRVRAKLEGREFGEGVEGRSVEGQVQQLMADAQDPQKLARMFFGWAPWA
ncbi:unnamed protein product [Pedinophyceae sp. YPF-701]|nr:unnamed protein product [Pedinophyceae sp. YPF-701]